MFDSVLAAKRKMFVLTICGFVACGVLFSLLMWRTAQDQGKQRLLELSESDPPILSTGAREEEGGDVEDIVDLGAILISKVPIQLPTGTVIYNYKIMKLEIEYCGDQNVLLQDLRTKLDEIGLKKIMIDENKILFTRTGEC